jgi:hypothetical protein
MRKSMFVLLLVFPALFFLFPIIALDAKAQTGFSVSKSVNGTYISPDGQVELALPEGWNGAEVLLNDSSNSVIMIAGQTSPDLEGDAYANATISLIIKEQQEPKITSYLDLLPFLKDDSYECRETSTTDVRINEATGIKSTANCENSQNGSLNMTAILIRTEAKQVIAVYVSPPHSYDDHLEEFDASLKSLKIFGAIDIFPAEQQLTSTSIPVEVNGTMLALEIQSSSEIREFQVVESERQIRFQSHNENNAGVTIIPISRILEGPYIVTIDGQIIDNVQVVDDQVSQERMIRLTHEQGTHDITVSGARIVPEFATSSVMGIILAIIATTSIMAIRRSKFNVV